MRNCYEGGNERTGGMTGKRETASPDFSGHRAKTGTG